MKEVDPPTYAEMEDFGLNLESSPSSQECLDPDPALLQTYLDVTHQRLSMLSKRQLLQTEIITIARRKDPLPYSTFQLNQDQRKCALCVPPFLPLTGDLVETLACSFECGKHNVVEHMEKRQGFRLKHGKLKRLADGKGATREICLTETGYMKLCLHCEFGGVFHSHKSAVIPEAQRDKRSTRVECPFRVNFAYVEAAGCHRVSHAVLPHNHDLVTTWIQ